MSVRIAAGAKNFVALRRTLAAEEEEDDDDVVVAPEEPMEEEDPEGPEVVRFTSPSGAPRGVIHAVSSRPSRTTDTLRSVFPAADSPCESKESEEDVDDEGRRVTTTKPPKSSPAAVGAGDTLAKKVIDSILPQGPVVELSLGQGPCDTLLHTEDWQRTSTRPDMMRLLFEVV
jgi:hypothetical protein